MSWASLNFGDVITMNNMRVTKFADEGTEVVQRVQLGFKTHKGKHFFALYLGVIEPKEFTTEEFEKRMRDAGWVPVTEIENGKKSKKSGTSVQPARTDGRAGEVTESDAGAKVPDGSQNQTVRPRRKARASG